MIVPLLSRLLPLPLSGARGRQAAYHYVHLSSLLRAISASSDSPGLHHVINYLPYICHFLSFFPESALLSLCPVQTLFVFSFLSVYSLNTELHNLKHQGVICFLFSLVTSSSVGAEKATRDASAGSSGSHASAGLRGSRSSAGLSGSYASAGLPGSPLRDARWCPWRGYCHACSCSSSLVLEVARLLIITHTYHHRYAHQRFIGLTWTHLHHLISYLPYICHFLSFFPESALMSLCVRCPDAVRVFFPVCLFIKYSLLVLASRLPASVLTINQHIAYHITMAERNTTKVI